MRHSQQVREMHTLCYVAGIQPMLGPLRALDGSSAAQGVKSNTVLHPVQWIDYFRIDAL